MGKLGRKGRIVSRCYALVMNRLEAAVRRSPPTVTSLSSARVGWTSDGRPAAARDRRRENGPGFSDETATVAA